jgi:flagellar hook assembly protein FlgD
LRSTAVTLLVLGLLAGTAAAFTVTEHLKLERSPIARPHFTKLFSPTCSCEHQTAHLVFRLRKADRIDAVVVDSEARPVRTLVTGDSHRPGPVRLLWDGRDDGGNVVPDGVYRLRVRLAKERRTILMPTPIFVDTTRPKVRLADAAPTVFSPDGDGRKDTVALTYTVSEGGRPFIIENGTVAGEGGFSHRGRAVVEWDGTLRGQPLPAGPYELRIRFRDRAGNFSAQSKPVEVEIAYIHVSPALVLARRGGNLRFHAVSDAVGLSWRLLKRGRTVLAGTAQPGVVEAALPRRLRPGRYQLRVSANGHSDTVLVRILRGGA